MKKIILLSLMIILMAGMGLLNAAHVKNPDKPLKGQWEFDPQEEWSIEGAGEQLLVSVNNVRVDDAGKVYAFDRKHNKFFVFSPEGKFLYAFGKKGEGPGEYKFAMNFYLVGKYVAVQDMGALHYFSKDGTYVKTFRPKRRVFPRAFLDEHRFINVRDAEEGQENEMVEIYDLTTDTAAPVVEVAAEEALTATAESGGGRMVLKIKDSSATPMVQTALHNNTLLYGKNDAYAIKKIDLKGKELMSFSLEGRKRKAITMEMKKKRIDGIVVNGGKMPKAMADQMIKGMADQCTFFGGLQVDENGLIYTYVMDVGNETGREVDIFSPDGKYLYHGALTLPDGLTRKSSLLLKKNFMYVFAEDEDGESKLYKYRVKRPTN